MREKYLEGMEASKRYAEGALDDFLVLPRKCQELFFQHLEYSTQIEEDGYLNFYAGGLDYSYRESPIEVILAFAYELLYPDPQLILWTPQVEIKANGKTYIIDFQFSTEGNFDKEYKLLVECDGHNYHNKTKDQVKRDNERDYNLKLAGYDILRFSGSQIYNDPFKCAKEIYEYLMSKVEG